MSPKSVLVSCCSLSCLGIILLILSIAYYFFSSESTSGDHKDAVSESHKEVVGSFVLVSDIEGSYENVDIFISQVNGLKPDFIIALGDLTSLGVKSDMERLKKAFTALEMPIYYIPGDRDLWKSSGIANFEAVFGNSYQKFFFKGFNFLLLDNSNEYEGIDQAQMLFIKENIAKADFIFIHNPIYFDESWLGLMKKGMGQYSADVDKQRLELLQYVRESSVHATFAGDQHYFSESVDSEASDIRHVVVGSLSTDRNLDMPNFATVELYKDGSFKVIKVYLQTGPLNSSSAE